jgi:hypothetical protein
MIKRGLAPDVFKDLLAFLKRQGAPACLNAIDLSTGEIA